MTTQEKFDKTRLIETEARQIKRNFISELVAQAEATFLTVAPLEMRVNNSSIDIIVTENSPRVSFEIKEDWNWENPGLEVHTRMGSCSGARAEDFLAMAKFAPAMETAINNAETEIANRMDDINTRTNDKLDVAMKLRAEAQIESNEAAKVRMQEELDNFNNNILNQGKFELDEPTPVQLTANWTPRVSAIEITQGKKQDSFTVKVWMTSGNSSWVDTERVCGKFKKNVMNLFK